MELAQYALLVHLTTVSVLITTVVVTDLLGLSWLLGKRETLPLRVMQTLHRVVWTGLLIMILSGGTMFLSYREYLLSVPAFYVKIAFILTLVINAFFIGRHLAIASERAYSSLARAERIPLLISGGVSAIAWIGIISAALMLGL